MAIVDSDHRRELATIRFLSLKSRFSADNDRSLATSPRARRAEPDCQSGCAGTGAAARWMGETILRKRTLFDRPNGRLPADQAVRRPLRRAGGLLPVGLLRHRSNRLAECGVGRGGW